MLTAFIHGFLLAFGLILPLGVQNVFIFNQGARQSRFLYALPAVLTAGLCDTLLISAAVMGVSLVLLEVSWLKNLLMAAGFLFLLYMGWQTWKSSAAPPSENEAETGTGPVPRQGQETGTENEGASSPRKQILFAASVSLLNPHAILDTVGVIGTGSLNYTGTEKAAYAGACILVSWVWFSGLAWMGRAAGKAASAGRLLDLINKISALIIWGAALYLGYSLIPA